jgi:hypothetical protein
MVATRRTVRSHSHWPSSRELPHNAFPPFDARRCRDWHDRAYTDTAGLLGILASRCLFATDYRYLNDATEGSLIKDLIVPILESEITELIPKLVAKRLIKGFYEFHGASGHRSLAEGFYRSLVGVVNKVSPLFILSFCRHEQGSQQFQHGLLSQWRAYGGSGGFALEFDEKRTISPAAGLLGSGPGTEQPMPTGFSYEEATAICESAVGTIKSRVNSARTRLSKLGSGPAN